VAGGTGLGLSVAAKFGFQPQNQIPQVLPLNPITTDPPSMITGTLRKPLECFSMVSKLAASLTTLR